MSSPNSTFASARPIPSKNTVTVSGDSTNAGEEPGEPAIFGRLHNTLWWKWTAPVDVSPKVAITTRGSIRFSGARYDTVMGVYTGSSLGSLTIIEQDDDAFPYQDSTGLFDYPYNYNSLCVIDAVPGQTYYVQVGGYSSDDVGFTVVAIAPATWTAWTPAGATTPYDYFDFFGTYGWAKYAFLETWSETWQNEDTLNDAFDAMLTASITPVSESANPSGQYEQVNFLRVFGATLSAPHQWDCAAWFRSFAAAFAVRGQSRGAVYDPALAPPDFVQVEFDTVSGLAECVQLDIQFRRTSSVASHAFGSTGGSSYSGFPRAFGSVGHMDVRQTTLAAVYDTTAFEAVPIDPVSPPGGTVWSVAIPEYPDDATAGVVTSGVISIAAQSAGFVFALQEAGENRHPFPDMIQIEGNPVDLPNNSYSALQNGHFEVASIHAFVQDPPARFLVMGAFDPAPPLRTPDLRQVQRDDGYPSAPGRAKSSGNMPTTRQDSIRQGGANTYW